MDQLGSAFRRSARLRRTPARRPTIAVTVAVIACLANAQRQILHVGTGTFAEIQSAIDAAAPGDRIVVHPRATPYATFVLRKGLDIEGSGTPRPQVVGSLVAGLPTGLPATLARLEFVPPGAAGAGLDVRDCFASVTVLDCRLTGGPDAAALDIRSCTSVHVDHSSLASGDAVQRSDVAALRLFGGGGAHLASCTLLGGAQTSPNANGVPAAAVLASQLVIVASDITGGRVTGPGGPALIGNGHALVIHRSQLRGGCGAPSGAAVAFAAAAAEVATDCTLVGPVLRVVPIPPQPYLHVPLEVGVGRNSVAAFEGDVRTTYTLYADADHRQIRIPGLRMPLQVRPTALPMFTASSGATGILFFLGTAPPDPGLRDLQFVLQAFALPTLSPQDATLTNAVHIRFR
jgi:hypothetical protein